MNADIDLRKHYALYMVIRDTPIKVKQRPAW